MRRRKSCSLIICLLVIATVMGAFPIAAGAVDVPIDSGAEEFTIVYSLPDASYDYRAGQIKITVPDGVTIKSYEWNKDFYATPDTMISGHSVPVNGGLIHTIGFASETSVRSGISITINFTCGSDTRPTIVINSFEYSADGNSMTTVPVNVSYDVTRPGDPVTYSVTYDLNGGSGTAPTDSVKKAAGETFHAAETTGMIAPSGKKFDKWNLKIDGTGTGYLTGDLVTMPDHDLTLYAIWVDAPGGSTGGPTGNTGDPTVDIGDDQTPLAEPYVRSKYFDDVDESWSWAFKEIDALYELGVVKGIGNNLYNPSANVTRADFILMLVRAFELNAEVSGNFDDVTSDKYYYDAVAIAKELGIAKGYAGKFNPESPISRQDMMVIVYRILEYIDKPLEAGSEADTAVFSDSGLISDYAKTDVAALVHSGLIIGNDGKVNPLGNTTRAEIAVFLYRVINFIQQ